MIYPLKMPQRQINVGRVSVNQCTGCGYLIPTPGGQAKLLRTLAAFGGMLAESGRSPDERAQANIEGTLPEPVKQESAQARRIRGGW